MTPARVIFRGGEEREEVNWRRELNLREAQITALEREVAILEGDDCWIPTRHGPVALPR